MGRSLARRGWLETADDIFYLTRSEVRKAMLSLEPLADYGGVVRGHKLDIERYRNIPLPSTIYGDAVSPIPDPSLEKLVGISTSVGCYTGRTVSVRGIRDFPKVNQGDVLVIPYSDVSWIPLFARVGAVISESGGLLSHSSIGAGIQHPGCCIRRRCDATQRSDPGHSERSNRRDSHPPQ